MKAKRAGGVVLSLSRLKKLMICILSSASEIDGEKIQV
jgi:hypothetical protein